LKELVVEAIVENIDKVIDFVNDELKVYACSLEVQSQISIIIDEIFSNIAYYAYTTNTGEITTQVEIDEEPRKVISITFIDRGNPYNVLLAEAPDITLSAEERKIGGLGIFLVKQMADEIDYEFSDGCNVLKVRKYLEK